jgi:hypothetical protein
MRKCPRCSAHVLDNAARFCGNCASELPQQQTQAPAKTDNTRIVLGVILVAAIFLALIVIGTTGSSHETGTQTLILNTYRTPGGHPCTSEDWSRQFLKGLKAGEEPCGIVGETKSVVPLPVKSEYEKETHYWEYLCSKLRDKKLADLSQNDLDRLALCKASGH